MYSLSSLGLWLAGWLDQSRRQQHNLLARGAQLLDIFSSVYAHLTAAFAALLRGDLDEARQLADQGVHLATQHGPFNYVTMGRVVQGCIAVRGGDFETGLHTLQKSLPDYRATPGNRGVRVLRRAEGDVVHFLLVTFWDSFDAIRAFAGDDVERARYYPEDEEFLLELEPRVVHYEVIGEA